MGGSDWHKHEMIIQLCTQAPCCSSRATLVGETFSHSNAQGKGGHMLDTHDSTLRRRATDPPTNPHTVMSPGLHREHMQPNIVVATNSHHPMQSFGCESCFPNYYALFCPTARCPRPPACRMKCSLLPRFPELAPPPSAVEPL